jgi:hypothetical protein
LDDPTIPTTNKIPSGQELLRWSVIFRKNINLVSRSIWDSDLFAMIRSIVNAGKRLKGLSAFLSQGIRALNPAGFPVSI